MKELLKRVKPGMRIASMGYPDILSTPDEVSEIVGNVGLEYLPKSVSERHGVDYLIPEAVGFFKVLGIELDVFDIMRERGCESYCDLNRDYFCVKRYDIVIDIGTLEHCFNIGQALINMAGFVKKDGYILHENPYNWGNHGFYNLNPTLFNDFYEQNGFELLSCVAARKNSIKTFEVPMTNRFFIARVEANLITVARNTQGLAVFKCPQQTKYKKG